jgi:hypothetical protein
MILALCLAVYLVASTLAICYQNFRYKELKGNYKTMAATFNKVSSDRDRLDTETLSKLREICRDLTPSPVESMSNEVAQHLVDVFETSSYRN